MSSMVLSSNGEGIDGSHAVPQPDESQVLNAHGLTRILHPRGQI